MTNTKALRGQGSAASPSLAPGKKRRLAERLGNDPEKLAAAEQIIERAQRMNPD